MKKVYVKLSGVKIITFVQIIMYVAAFTAFFFATVDDDLMETFLAICGGLVISALLATPLKKIVKAAEYYIGVIESDNEIIIGKKRQDQTPTQQS